MSVDNFQVYDFIAHPVFVLTSDANNHPVYHHMNVAALRYMDRSLDDLRGLPAHEVFSGRAAYSVYRHQCMAWAKGVATDYEIALPVNGRIMWVHTHLAPVRDMAGRLTHMVGVSQDISKVRAALQVQAMDAALTQEMEDLVCFAAHDLRTPIGNLKSLAELMRADFVDHGDGKSDLIDMIDTISDKALSAVGSIMSQAMATSSGASHEAFDLGALCDDITIMLDPTGRHSIVYPCKRLEADSTVVHIILRNLVDNALKHSGKAIAQVTIDVSQVTKDRLLFVVRDDGVGFLDNPTCEQGTPPKSDVSGFGFKGIKRLARARRGQLTVVTPNEGSGAEIHVELPGNILDAAAEDAPQLHIA